MSDSIHSNLPHNFKVLQDLKEGERVGIDSNGHLYSYNPSNILSRFVHFFLNLFSGSKIEKIGLDYAMHSLKTRSITAQSKTEFEEKIQSLVNHKVLDPEIFEKKELFNKTEIHLIEKIRDPLILEQQKKFDDSVKYLIETGEDPLIAEAKVSIKMAYDTSIPEKYRKIILPQRAAEGASGAYFVKNRFGENIGVFKPQDEEVNQENSLFRSGPPSKRTFRMGHPPGTAYKNEVLAYQLDHGHFAGVPKTQEITVFFPQQISINNRLIEKRGSFQAFVKGESCDYLKDDEINSIPVQEVHRVGLFDLNMGNADRHLGNVLYDEKEKKLHPIDHGLCYLDSLDWDNKEVEPHNQVSESQGGWMALPQSKVPFSEESKKFAKEYDIERSVNTMKKEGFSLSQQREHRMRCIFSKECVERDFTLYEIGDMSCLVGVTPKKHGTVLDECRKRALQNLKDAGTPITDETFFPMFEKVVKERLDNIHYRKQNFPNYVY